MYKENLHIKTQKYVLLNKRVDCSGFNMRTTQYFGNTSRGQYLINTQIKNKFIPY